MLIPFSENDFVHFFQLMSNEKAMIYVTGKALSKKEAHNKFQEILEINKKNEKFCVYKLLDKKSKEFLGLAKLIFKDQNCKELEMGYMLLPKNWGKGIGSKLVEKLLEMARSEGNIKLVRAIIDPKNLPSRKILIKNNFLSEKFCDIDGWPSEILILKL